MSGLVNKVKDALHSDKSTTHSQPEGTHGPHSSRTANAADPRVDSDRDHRANPHSTTTGTTGGRGSSNYATSGTHEPLSSTHGTHEGAYGSGVGGTNRGYDGPATKTDGPHSSNLANKADPRVDSDRDYSRNMGANPQRSAATGTHSTTTTGTTGHHSTLGSSTGTTGTTGHNTLGSSTGTTGTTGHNTLGSNTGSGVPEGTYGTHNSRLANAADPRIDSDRDHRGAPGNTFGSTTGHSSHTHTTGTTGGLSSTGPGPAPNTAGPHKSDMLNKADPRVDSDMDGSKTYGGNKTYAQ